MKDCLHSTIARQDCHVLDPIYLVLCKSWTVKKSRTIIFHSLLFKPGKPIFEDFQRQQNSKYLKTKSSDILFSFFLKGVFAKNERGYRLTAKNYRW